MEQSKIYKNVTIEKVCASAQEIIGRDLTEMEMVLMDYALEQVRLGLVK
jgi:hypothetical protein